MGGRVELLGGAVGGHGISMGKWDYMFVVEFSASNDSAVNEAALNNLREFTGSVRILGEYASAEALATRKINSNNDVQMAGF